MSRQLLAQLAATGIATVLLVAGGCGGGGGSSQDNSREIRGIVLLGTESGIANPTGADGLVPAGAGATVRITNTDYHVNVIPTGSATTDTQGRFTYRIKNDASISYLFDIDRGCSTVASVGIESDGLLYAVDDPGSTDGRTPSDAMKRKAFLASQALAVDVVVLVNTDLDTCQR